MVDIKDSFVRLYVKQYIMPRALIFDKPGFVDFKISGKTPVFARQIVMPEQFFVTFQKALIEEFGDKGKQMIYSAGKKFGYSFAELGRFESIKDHPGEAVKDWVIIASKFVEGTYASSISQAITVSSKTVDYTLKNFVIARKLGYDLFFACGGAAGLIAWILQEPRIEARQYDSHLEGATHVCKVKCAPEDALAKEFKGDVYAQHELSDLEQDAATYKAFNEEAKIKYDKSFQTYLNAGLFTYRNGVISYKNKDERFFLMEVTAAYLLEKEMDTAKAKKILFDSAVSTGAQVFGGFDLNALVEILSGLGWGEVSVVASKKGFKVIICRFPWAKYYKEVDYTIVRGLLSGALAKITGREITFGKPTIDLSNGYLTLLFEQE